MGKLIAIEGIDGTGKSTLAKNLYKALKERGFDAVLSFEPTFGRYGKILRQSFTSPERLSPEEELRLFTEDRREHVRDFIEPALKRGKTVVLDRYYLSTIAYQGARGLEPEKIRIENEAFSPRPDLAIILVLDPECALRRIEEKRGEPPNSFEALDYLERVQNIFDELDYPFIKKIDASKCEEEILEEALNIIIPLAKEDI